ncbi:hypothetical protein [Methanolobus vulcani]|uniref:Uncharacterized protein n=1 Tax=Methanolobus vulcani TaxID=38026 RepID=A0A7Z8KPN4_9EURY|nr:hypothetical protein [Methanolobus vulcani]TQD23909.1 hypothetical protein FKV42_11920 [Methanolobus vulcani]
MNSELVPSLDKKITEFSSLPVIEGYYLVLGGGKIGSDFARYAREKSFSFVVIIDVDKSSNASNSSVTVGREELLNLIKYFHKSKSKSDNVYFHCMDVRNVPEILEAGIPEFIIPAVPTHAVVNMAIDMLGSFSSGNLISAVQIADNDEKMTAYFNGILSLLPENIVVFNSPKDGAIMLSYAKMGEICPDNCMGPAEYCYNFKREKPETITAYARKLLPIYKGWVFESCQMKPGIGGIRGVDFKEYMLSLMEHVKSVSEKRDSCTIKDRVFFIATTCNCHGIMNLLEVQ